MTTQVHIFCFKKYTTGGSMGSTNYICCFDRVNDLWHLEKNVAQGRVVQSWVKITQG